MINQIIIHHASNKVICKHKQDKDSGVISITVKVKTYEHSNCKAANRKSKKSAKTK